MTTREQLIETVNRLFVYTDYQKWDQLKDEVFSEHVHFDMTSLGGEAKVMSSKEICAMWKDGFQGIDAINHLAGNYLVDLHGDDQANVFAYATATHYKANAKHGNTREFVGSYNLELKKSDNGWRINAFKYKLKYMSGNSTLE